MLARARRSLKSANGSLTAISPSADQTQYTSIIHILTDRAAEAQPAHGREEESKVEVMERWQGGKQRLNADEKRKFRNVGRKIKMEEESEGMERGGTPPRSWS